MPGRKVSKYSPQYNSEMKVALFDALLEAKEAVTIDQLRTFDLKLVNMTTQKAARLLNELVNAGAAVKGKHSGTGHMTYKAVGTMIHQGYELGHNRGYEYNERML
jgi:hypothetical protein